MNRPFFSIVIPCYGAEEYFGKTTNSILKQSFVDVELILVNDCSPGNVAQMCDELAEKDERVKVLHRETNGGISRATNDGIDVAMGEYITFLDNDDYFEEGIFQKVYDKIKNCLAVDNMPIDIFQCNYRETYEGESRSSIDRAIRYPPYISGDYKEYVLMRRIRKQLPCSNASKFVRLDYINKINLRFKPRYDSFQDFDFAMRLYLDAERVEYSEIFSYVHIHRGSSVSNDLSTDACINRINQWTDWFDYVEGIIISDKVKRAFLAYMAKRMLQIWKLVQSGKRCKDNIDKVAVYNTPVNTEKYVRYLRPSFKRWVKAPHRALEEWRLSHKLRKVGVPSTFG